MPPEYRVALIGAGYISAIHAEALRSVPGVKISAIVDTNEARAKALGAAFGVQQIFPSISHLLANNACDAAHVLVPPHHHFEAAAELLRRGVHVFLEKPMATSSSQCTSLEAIAAEHGARLGINQNFVFHPAFVRLRERLKGLGRLHHIAVHYNVQLRQLQARQFGHWMFQAPENILLEQAVHPLSQILTLTGPIESVSVLPQAPRHLTPGLPFYGTWQIALRGSMATAQLFLSVGQDFPTWGISAICADGMITADILNDRLSVQSRTKWPDFFDSFINGVSTGFMSISQSSSNLSSYIASILRLRPRSDPFFISMRESIAAFYRGLGAGKVPVDGKFGLDVVRLCEQIAEAGGVAPRSAPATTSSAAAVTRAPNWDIAVLGGTGFIGTHVVRRLISSGHRIAVLARNTKALPEVFSDPRVHLIPGDVHTAADVIKTIGNAKTVINLSPGASGTTVAEVVGSMNSAVRIVAESCLQQGVTRLVHTSSIASLYLGNSGDTIGAATPPDPRSLDRAPYARAKAEGERILLELHRDRRLPVVILRPGVVVGEGGLAFHSGLGFYNADRHCLGWNRGSNPLPFVLAEDTASAIATACTAPDIEGRCFNLVGDVRLTAREYIAELARVLERPLVFYPQSPAKLFVLELGKWIIKRAIGRRDAPRPSYRDFLSRGLAAGFDCSDTKSALSWSPISHRAEFIKAAIETQKQS